MILINHMKLQLLWPWRLAWFCEEECVKEE